MTQRRAVVLAIGGVAAAGALAAVLIVLTGRHGGGGAESRTELFQAVVGAAARGDAPALLALHVSAGAATVTKCAPKAPGGPDEPTGRYSPDPDEMKAYESTQLAEQLSWWKDRAVTVQVLGEHDEPEVLPPADGHARARCTRTAAVTLHELDAALEEQDGDHRRTKHTTLAAMEIEDGWYFLDLPAPPTTTADLTRLRDRMCGCATDRDPTACTSKVGRALDQWMQGVRDADLRAIEDQVVGCRRTASGAR